MAAARLFGWLSSAVLLVACANGGAADDSGDEFDSGDTLEGSAVEHDSGSSTAHHDSGGTSSGGTGTPEASSGDGGSSQPESSTTEEASSDEASTVPESGTTTPESGTSPESGTTGQPESGTTTGGTCGSAAKYDIEAAAEIASGTITLCLSGNCASGYCCFTGLSPGDVCVQD